ncbi:UNVERIFIED_CONTAM: hypothetical protein Slati_1999600 [Sesamum latifolium]|uniref:Uncharacterized protein n=1 Tax=Sesamum latifolium TaxID=2727402 RepID=A0AAW2WP38_9LAMI
MSQYLKVKSLSCRWWIPPSDNTFFPSATASAAHRFSDEPLLYFFLTQFARILLLSNDSEPALRYCTASNPILE